MTHLHQSVGRLLHAQASRIIAWLSWATVLLALLTTVLFGFLVFGPSDGESLYAFIVVVVPMDVALSLLLGVIPSGIRYWKQHQPADRASLRRSSLAIVAVVAEALAFVVVAVFT